MALDIENTQKEALKEINNLKKTNEAIDSLDKQKGIDSLINSTESIKEEGGNILQYFLDLLQTLGGQSAITNLRKKMAKSTEKLYLKSYYSLSIVISTLPYRLLTHL